MDLNFLDYAIIGLAAVSTFLGFRKGLIREVFSVIGVVLGLLLATYYQSNIIKSIETRWDLPLVENKAAVFIIVLLAVIFIFSILGRLITFFSARHVTLTVGNRLGGALFGLGRGLIITALILVLILKINLPLAVNMQVYRSNLSGWILRHSLKVYERLVTIFPGRGISPHIDSIGTFISKEKVDQLKDTPSLTIYQDFLDDLAKDKENFIPQKIKELRQLRKGGDEWKLNKSIK